MSHKSLTPPQIVKELDKYIVSQEAAKRSVAIALRNRWRRMQISDDLKDEVTPKNILMIGPTGVGKTEISRRLAKLVNAPFVKVEASKFTEVGYVGRDVESIIRDLVEVGYHMAKETERSKVKKEAEKLVEDKILNALLPGKTSTQDETENQSATKEKLLTMLHAGKLEEREIDIEITKSQHTHLQFMGPQGLGEIEGQIKDMFSNMVPKQTEKRKLKVSEARKLILEEMQDSLIDSSKLAEVACKSAAENGIVFIDEIDKICAVEKRGADVSREGVQRDLLPLVEGCTVSTKYGPIKTDHILFISSGAFHVSKPSDLIPEFQGRFSNSC